MSRQPFEENARTSIYILKDPRNNNVRYVGKTSVKLETRLKQHVYRAQHSEKSNHKDNWINSLITSGVYPEIEEIDFCKWDNSAELEIDYINKYTNLGYDLLNATLGGEGTLGRKLSSEQLENCKIQQRKNLKKINQFSVEKVFIREWNSAPEAAETLHINSSGITRCLRGERTKYKNYIWEYSDTDIVDNKDNSTTNTIKSTVKKPHSDLAKLISLESRIKRDASSVYVFSSNIYTKDNFLFEGITLLDVALWCIDNKYSTAKNPNSLKSNISASCRRQTPYLNLYFTTNKPDFIEYPKSTDIIKFEVYDSNNNIICTTSGIARLSEMLEVKNTNIINYMKCITTYILIAEEHCKLSWKIKQEYCRLIEQSIGVSVGKIEESPNNYRITSS